MTAQSAPLGEPPPDQPIERAGDVRDFLKTLPITRHPATGEDYTGSDWFTASNTYPLYARAAAVIRPASVLEVGTLLGFGLASFVFGAPGIERLTAVDNESYIPGSLTLCAENLSFFTGEKRFLGSLEAARGAYDLIHVDADHAFPGALHDMAFCWGLGPRVMLVDDYDFLDDVRHAVHTFAEHQMIPFKLWKSFRGWAVFAEPATFASLPDAL